MLIQEMMDDPLLSKYSVIMVDDIHERSVQTDLLLSLLKKIRKNKRSDLKLIISSATLNDVKLAKFFEEKNLKANILQIEGR